MIKAAVFKVYWVWICAVGLCFGNSIFLGCVNSANCPRYVQIPSSIVPDQTDVHVGDTISIISKFHREEVLAFNSEEKEIGFIDMADFDWKPATIIFRTDTLGQAGVTSVHKFFSFVNNPDYNYGLQIISETFSVFVGDYNYTNDTFDLQFKFIPTQAGTYFLRQESTASPRDDQHFRERCPGLDVNVWVNMNNSGDYTGCNIELLTESPDPHYNTAILANPKSQFYHFGGYCFRVLP